MAHLSKKHTRRIALKYYENEEFIMKTKTVILLAILLGLFTYTLPLYAAGKEHHIEEITVIDIPVVGKISTRTTSYLGGCKLKEVTTIKLHNALVQMLSESDGKSHDCKSSK